jgi:RNA polymerase sigma factor (sigma-70 family)
MASGQLAIVVRQIHQFAGNADPAESTDGRLLERFLAGGEEDAFAALVRRHGPMVLGVCRRVLRDRHAAEDAFQATFLVLLRRARFLDRRGSVASWLYTVAYHVALRARAEAARRQRLLRPVAQPPAGEPAAGWNDLQPILDEELERLPETYRAVVVLCYLEGKTNAEAARLLGWPVGTVKGRLARARELLRARLTRRGITLAGGLFGVALGGPATAALSASLVQMTLRTALPGAALTATRGAPSTAAVALAEGALRTMFTTKPRAVAALLFLVGLVALGVGASTHPAQAQRQAATQLKARPAGEAMPKGPAAQLPLALGKKGAVKDEELALAGRVLGADGKALPGANVAVLGWRPGRAGEKPRVLAQARTDRDGKFALKVRPPSPAYALVALATATGHALGWHRQLPDPKVEIRLPPEEVLRGRLIDLQGQPAAGVKLDVVRLGPRVASDGRKYVLMTDLDGDLDDLEDDEVIPRPVWMNLTLRTGRTMVLDMNADSSGSKNAYKTPLPGLVLPEPPADWPAWPGSVTTDAQGRFELRGVPRGLGAGLRVRDPRFAVQLLDLPAPEKSKPAEVTRVLNPVRVLEGTVTDTASGKPVPHARVKVHAPGDRAGFRLVTSVRFRFAGGLGGADAKGRQGMGGNARSVFAFSGSFNGLLPDDGDLPPLEVQADEKGRFRINLFHADSYTLRVAAPRGEPYLARTLTVRWPQGAVVRKEQNVELVRGVEVRGRVTEAPGGKPVALARVDFWSRGLELPQGVRHPRPIQTRPDGTFRALLPAGSWHLLVNGPESVYLYQPIPVGKLVAEDGAGGQPAPAGKGDNPRQAKSGRPSQFYPDAWKALELKAGEGPREVSFTLRRAPVLSGRVVGPDGKPASGVRLLRRPVLPPGAVPVVEGSNTTFLLLDAVAVEPVTNQILIDAESQSVIGRLPGPVELRDGTFSIPVLDPDVTFPLLFLDPARDLGAFVKLPGKQAGGEPVTVRLEACGTARARFVDDKGKPLAEYQPNLLLLLPPGPHPVPDGLTDRAQRGLRSRIALGADQLDPRRYQKGPATDAGGRATLPGLIPGATYRLLLSGGKTRDFSVRSGEPLDLGELTAVRPPAPRAPTPVKEGGVRKTKVSPVPVPTKTP